MRPQNTARVKVRFSTIHQAREGTGQPVGTSKIRNHMVWLSMKAGMAKGTRFLDTTMTGTFVTDLGATGITKYGI